VFEEDNPRTERARNDVRKIEEIEILDEAPMPQ